MMNRFFVLSTLAWLGLASAAPASVTFSYVAVPESTLSAGGSATVNLYLQEVATGSSSSIVAAESGLYSAAIAIVQKSGTGVTISGVTPNGSNEPNGFTGNVKSGTTNSSTNAYIAEVTSSSYTGSTGPSGTTTNGSVTTVNGITTTLVFLGSLNLAATSSATQTTFNIESLKNAPAASNIPGANSNGNTLSFANGYDLDLSNQGPYTYSGANANVVTFTVLAAVPEPSSMLLCGLAICGMGYNVYRRRKAKAGQLVAAA